MGQHTWFEKDRTLHEEQSTLYSKLDAFENGEIYLDDLELLQINNRIDEIGALNDADYHDLFITNKRNEDGTYTNDVIYSKEECERWLKENNIKIIPEDKEHLDKFWEEFPNGVIHFG